MTIRQIRFAKEYILNKGNGTRAALMAYDAMDKNSAAMIASENLRKPKIQDHIAELTRVEDETIDELRRRVLSELKAIGFREREDIDLREQLRALELLGRFLGMGAPAQLQDAEQVINVYHTIPPTKYVDASPETQPVG